MSTINDHDSDQNQRPVISASWQYWQKIKAKSAETDSARVASPPEFPKTDLRELLEETGLTNHEISLITSISPAYLSAIKRGLIQKAGREKLLLLLMVALSMSLDETNTILKAYGYEHIDQFDAKLLIDASLKKTIRGFQTIRSKLSITLILLSMESLLGDTVLVHKMPDPALIPVDYAMALGDSDDKTYMALMAHVHEKRIELFNESLEKGENRYCLMCQHCLKQYLQSYKVLNGPKKDSIIAHLKSTIDTLNTYDNFRVDLLTSCQRNWFRLKLLPSESTENGKVVFAGRSSHLSETKNDLAAIRLFATDNKRLYNQFLKELDRLTSKFIFPIDDMPTHLAKLVKEEAGVDL